MASPPGENKLLDQDKPLGQEKLLDQHRPLSQEKLLDQDKVLDKDKFLDQDKPLDQSPAPMRCLQPTVRHRSMKGTPTHPAHAADEAAAFWC